jgi:hypothetical protein
MGHRSFIAIGIAAIALVGGAAALMLVSPAGAPGSATPTAAPTSAPSLIAVVKIPTTTSLNAADCFARAAALMDALRNSPDAETMDRYDAGHFDAGTAAFVQKHEQIVAWTRAGAAQPLCDWGTLSMEEQLKMLNRYRNVSRFVSIHARLAAVQKQFGETMEDDLAIMALARRVGAAGLIVDKLVEVGMEMRAIDELAEVLPQLSEEQLAALTARIDTLPRPISGREVLLAESSHAMQSAREQGGNVILLAMAKGMEDFYLAIGNAMDQPTAEFDKVVDAEMERNKLNTLVQIAGPSLKRLRQPLAAIEAKRDLLLTAIDFRQRGQAAIDASHDRFGDGPYQYRKTGQGFILSSVLENDGAKVSLTVGSN